MQPWIGVDFDGTLASYDHWRGVDHVGDPIPKMCDRVREWLEKGLTVKVFTARVYNAHLGEQLDRVEAPIKAFCKREFGQELEITNVKDFGMVSLWDDRAVGVKCNTGEVCGE